jgi:hypothetical protein
MGDFVGPAGSGMRNAPIPSSSVPKEHRHIVTKAECREPISAYVDLLQGDTKGHLQSPWPADLVKLVSDEIYEFMNCMSAWRVIPRGAIVALVDTVRNRILSFALEIEAQDPTAGDGLEASRILPPAKVAQMFTTNIYGNVGNLAAGSQDVVQKAATLVQQGDFESLQKALTEIGLAASDIKQLRDALAADRGSGPPRKELGQQTGSWVGRAISKASTGALNVGTTVASNILTRAISRYLGLPG